MYFAKSYGKEVCSSLIKNRMLVGSFIVFFLQCVCPGLEVIKLEFILRLKIKHNDWLLEDTCLQAANHCTLF